MLSAESSEPIYSGQIKPPFPSSINLLKATGASGKATKIIGAIVGVVILGAILWVLNEIFKWKWLTYGGIALLAWALGKMIVSAFRSQQAACPYCNGKIGVDYGTDLSLEDKNKQFSCQHCFEWLLSNRGSIRAFVEADLTDQKEFDCPVFDKAIWPNECIVCGAAPVRFLDAKKTNFNVSSLLIGRLSVSFGSVKNIPYCAMHRDAISLKIVENKLQVVFNNYSARRRYLYLNQNRIKSFQK